MKKSKHVLIGIAIACTLLFAQQRGYSQQNGSSDTTQSVHWQSLAWDTSLETPLAPITRRSIPLRR